MMIPGALACSRQSQRLISAGAHIEILQLLASQATVALRNAQMYKEVPFIGAEPVLHATQIYGHEKRRRTVIPALCVLLRLFLVAFPCRCKWTAMPSLGPFIECRCNLIPKE
jgi:hypothetical protein